MVTKADELLQEVEQEFGTGENSNTNLRRDGVSDQGGEVNIGNFTESSKAFSEEQALKEKRAEEELSEEQTILFSDVLDKLDSFIEDAPLFGKLSETLNDSSGIDTVSEIITNFNVDDEKDTQNLAESVILESQSQGDDVNVNIGDGSRGQVNNQQEDIFDNNANQELITEETIQSNNAPIIDPIGDQSVLENGSTVVVFNASDIDGDDLNAHVSTTNGTVLFDENGSIVYSPNADFTGDSTITLTVSDGNGGITTQTFTMNVVDGGTAPELTVQSTKSVDEDGITSITYATSDTDGTIVSTTANAQNGTVIVNDDGTITYTPDENYNGIDTISVVTKDDDGLTTVKTSTITVNDINDAPTLTADSTKIVDEDGSISITFEAKDVDGAITTTANAQNGTIVVNDDGTITYTPDENYNGADTVTITTVDDDGASVSATTNISVSEVNDPPVIDTILTQQVSQNGTKTIAFTASDVDGDALTSSIPIATNGTATINENGEIVFTPDEGFIGTAGILLEVQDEHGAITYESFLIEVSENMSPTLTIEATATVVEDGTIVLDYSASDSDGTISSTTATVPTEQGTVVVNEDNTITFTPAVNFSGEAIITVTTTDDDGAIDMKTSIITVSEDGLSLAPTADIIDSSDTGSSSVDNITYDNTPTIEGTTENGATVVITNEAGDIVGTGTADENGVYSITTSILKEGMQDLTITATDSNGNTSFTTQNITIEISDIPVVENIVDTTGKLDMSITGTATAGLEIRVYDGDNLIGTTTSDENGNWTLKEDEITGNLSGDVEISAKSYNGNTESLSSNTLIVDIESNNNDSSSSIDDDSSHLFGGAGHDTLSGNDSDNIIDAGIGNDFIDAGAGADTINGGVGTDTVTYANSEDAVNVNLETNINTGGDAQGDNISNVENIVGSANDDTIIGNSEDNRIEGGAGADTIESGAGTDMITGGAGDDRISGGEGTDAIILNGAPTDYTFVKNNDGTTTVTDTRTGDENKDGVDIIDGIEKVIFEYTDENGDTVTRETPDIEQVYATPEMATIDSMSDATGKLGMQISGTADENTSDVKIFDADNNLVGIAQPDSDGNWSFTTENGALTGDVTLTAQAFNYGNSSDMSDTSVSAEIHTNKNNNDTVESDASENVFYGSGNDQADGSAGADILDGGAGTDTMDYSTSSEGVNVDLSSSDAQSGGDAQGDVLTNFERVTGSNNDDTLTGDDKGNYLKGEAGNDTIDGGAGNDRLYGGKGDDTVSGGTGNDTVYGDAGADVLDGGEGSDRVSYQYSEDDVNVNLTTNEVSGGDAQGDTISNFEHASGGKGDDNITGTDGYNSLYGNAGDDTINAGAGNDYVSGGSGADILDGGEGTDTLVYGGKEGVDVNLETGEARGGDAQGDTISNFENVTGTSYDDNITGDESNNYLRGGKGDDTLDGGAGDDSLKGEIGDDTIHGGDGVDTIKYSSAAENYTFTKNDDGTVTITDTRDGKLAKYNEGTDTVDGVEKVNFSYRDENGKWVNETKTMDELVGNNGPQAQDDTANTDEDSAVTVNVLKNDSDADNDSLSITKIDGQNVTNGQTATITDDNGNTLGTATVVNGEIVFTPSEYMQEMTTGESQDVSMEYTVSDGISDTIATATVNVTGNFDDTEASSPTLNMSIGEVNIVGDENNDTITIKTGNDTKTINTGSGDDIITTPEKTANKTVDGGDGKDTFIVDGNRADYDIQLNDNGSYTVTSITASGETKFANGDLEVTLENIEDIQFNDATVNIGTADATPLSYEYEIALNANLTDTDGSESLSNITLNNIPNGATISDVNGDTISANDDGSYTVAIDENGDATITLSADTQIDQNNLDSITSSVTSTESDGGNSSTVSATEDTFTMENSMNLDFDSLVDNNELSNLEAINLDSGDQSLTNIDINDVLNLTDEDNVLTILGDDNDHVELQNTDGHEWTQSDGTTEIDGNAFVTFSNGDATVLIQSDIDASVGTL